MSIYWIIYFFIVIGAIASFELKKEKYKDKAFEFKKIGNVSYATLVDKIPKILYYVAFVSILVIALLRCGQGSDYWGYYYDYQSVYNSFFISNDNSGGSIVSHILRPEGGHYLLLLISATLTNYLGQWVSFQVLIIVYAVFSMWQLNRFVSRYCSYNKLFALMMLYPTFYMTYILSGIGQGLAMAIFLGTLLPLLEEKKYIQYTVWTIGLWWIHRSAILYIICLVWIFINERVIEYITLVVIPISLILYCTGLTHRFEILVGDQFTNIPGRASLFAYAERIVSAIVVIVMFHMVENRSKSVIIAYRIYMAGLVSYVVLSFNGFVASRVFALFKALEITLIISLLKELYNKKKLLARLIIAFQLSLCMVMLYKNVGAYIYQLNYDCSVINYPYKTILMSEEDMLKDRFERAGY